MSVFFGGKHFDGEFFLPSGASVSGNFFGGPFCSGGFFGGGTPTDDDPLYVVCDYVQPDYADGDEICYTHDPKDDDKHHHHHHKHKHRGDPRRIYKPTGLPPVRAKGPVERRIEDTHEIAAEVTAKIAREFTEESPEIVTMSLAQIEREIGELLRKKLRTEEEEAMLLILLAAYS